MKTKRFLLAAGIGLAMAFTFSCSSGGGGNGNTCGGKEYDATLGYTCERGELVGSCKGEPYYPEYQYCDGNGEIKNIAEISSSSLSSVGGSSSSDGGGQGGSSSSSVVGQGGESSSSVEGGQGGSSSSSDGGSQGSSSSSSVGDQGGESSSSVGDGQGSSSSSSIVEQLACGSVPTHGMAGIAITPPVLTCSNGETPTDITWSESAPNWSEPVPSAYIDISVTATCGTASNLSVNCSDEPLLVVPCTASDNTSTRYCYGITMKAYGFLNYDGKAYKTVVIGTQTWMAENLNYNASGSRCYGDNSGGDNQNRCGTYGRLYNWATAMTACPSEWHLPSQAEWQVMTTHIGGANVEGKELKATSGWNSNGNGTDHYGFSARPGGFGYADGRFFDVGSRGHWWSSSEDSSDKAYYRILYYDIENALWYSTGKDVLFSVRCVQN